MMIFYLQSLGCGVWDSVVSGYVPSKGTLKSDTKKELNRNHKMALDVLL